MLVKMFSRKLVFNSGDITNLKEVEKAVFRVITLMLRTASGKLTVGQALDFISKLNVVENFS